ncbi:MAG: hypothetical protein ABSE75_00320 [Acidimicrobiales bacterium]|jgi:hypothetical protein
MGSRVGKRIFKFVAVSALTTTVAAGMFTVIATPANADESPATALARELLTQVIVPPAAVLAHPATAVVCQCVVASGTVTSEHRYYIVPGTPTSVEEFLSTHIPNGGRFDGKGVNGSSDAPPVYSMTIAYRANGPHIYLKQLAYSMTRRTSSTSWLRVDSQIVWVPRRTKSEMISHPVSAIVTGYKVTALSGSRGNVRVDLAGSALTTLIDRFNTLPLGPNNLCMEDLGGFSIALTLRDGEHLQIFNGFCAGSFDSVSAPTGNPKFGYRVSDRSCSFMRAVVGLFPAASVPGSRSALHSCEVWSKSIDP